MYFGLTLTYRMRSRKRKKKRKIDIREETEKENEGLKKNLILEHIIQDLVPSLLCHGDYFTHL